MMTICSMTCESCHWLYFQSLIISTVCVRGGDTAGDVVRRREEAACVCASLQSARCVPRSCVHCSGLTSNTYVKTPPDLFNIYLAHLSSFSTL